MRFHAQNLNEKYDYGDKTVYGSMLRHGRCWIPVGGNRHKSINLCWNLGPDAKFCHAYVELNNGDGDDLTFSLAVPFLFSIWVTFQNFLKSKYVPYGKAGNWNLWNTKLGLDLSLEYGTFRASFFNDNSEWRSKDSFWSRFRRELHFNIPDVLFGKKKIKTELLRTEEVEIPLPEGGVKATIKFQMITHSRPRWFDDVFFVADIDPEKGIPYGEKGPLRGMSCPAQTSAVAVGRLLTDVLRRRGSPRYWKDVV